MNNKLPIKQPPPHLHRLTVAHLFDSETNSWNMYLISVIFNAKDAAAILRIPRQTRDNTDSTIWYLTNACW